MLLLLASAIPFEIAPLQLFDPADPRVSHQQTSESPSEPILRRMSRPPKAMSRLAVRRCGRLRLCAGDAAIAASEQRPAGALAGALACPKGVFGGCDPEGAALEWRLLALITASATFGNFEQRPNLSRALCLGRFDLFP